MQHEAETGLNFSGVPSKDGLEKQALQAVRDHYQSAFRKRKGEKKEVC